MKNILITPEGIKKNLKNVKPLDAICEYIWNGFDAGASHVRVYLHTNEMGLINMVSIIDDGTGIVYDELPHKFQPFNESKKADLPSRLNHSLPHGRKGIGRLTFFSFAQIARWDTVYEKNEKKYKYYIGMNKDSLNEYDDNGGLKPTETKDSVGTKVTFTQLIALSKEEIIEEIRNEFFWFLELNESNKYRCLRNRVCLEYILTRGTLRQKPIPTKPRSRSVPDVVVLNSQLLAELLIKYQRLPTGFF